MLVVDRHTLRAVDLLHLVNEVQLHRTLAEDTKDLLGINSTRDELGAHLHVLAVFDEQLRALGHRLCDLLRTIVRNDDDLAGLVSVIDAHATGDLADRGNTLGGAGLEELDDTRKTVRDVIACHTTGVEGTHGQLSAGLADRLSGDDADGLADINQLAGRHRLAVAHGTGSDLALAGQDRTHADGLHALRNELLKTRGREFFACSCDDLAINLDIASERTSRSRGVDAVECDELAVNHLGQCELVAALGAAVDLADDDILRDVDQTTGQVTRVSGTKCGISKTLTRAVGRDEVLEHRQAFTEVGLDRTRDDLALRVSHEAAHTGDLANLHEVTASTRVDHHVHRVGAREVLEHGLGNLVSCAGPDLDELLATLRVGDQTELVLLLHLVGLLLRDTEQLCLAGRSDDIGDGDGDARAGCPVEAKCLQTIEGVGDVDLRVQLGELVHGLAENLLVDLLVHEGVVGRECLVEECATQGRLQHERLARDPALGCGEALRRNAVGETNGDLGLQREAVSVECHQCLGDGRERAAFADCALGMRGEEVDAQHHVLSRRRDRATMCRRQDVVAREHQDAGLGLRLCGQRHVHGHLVTVEVRVEGGADERVNLDGLALDQLRLESLDAEAVQRGCAVQQHGMLGDDLFENVPHDRARTLDHALGALDVLRVVEINQALHHERLEQLECHLLGQTALVQLELRADDDDRTARVVDALAEQVLAEAALLALEHVGQRLECTVARAGHRTTTTTVVEQCVDGLLEHALLVVDDDLRRTEIKQALEAVIAVDHATVEIVQVRGREAATIELNHRAQIRRDNRDCVEHHAGGRIGGVHERRDNLEALE